MDTNCCDHNKIILYIERFPKEFLKISERNVARVEEDIDTRENVSFETQILHQITNS
jgi:hypothetical protein